MSAALNQLRQQLASADPDGLYILLGDDTFAKEAALRAIEAALAGRAGHEDDGSAGTSPDGVEAARHLRHGTPDLDRTAVHADEVGVDALAVAVGSSSLFGDKRLVVIRSFEKLSAAEQDKLVPIVTVPPPGVVVIVVAVALDGRRKATKALQSAGRAITFALPQGEALSRWVIDHARTLGLDLPGPAAAALLELVPPEPQMIHTELEKLALYAAGERPDAQTVRRVASIAVPHAAERLIFRLTDLIVEGNTQPALTALHDLLAVGEVPLIILTMIGRQYRLIAAACGVSPGEAKQHLTRTFRVPPFVADQIVRQARAMGGAKAEAGLRRVLSADEAMKKSQDLRLTLETLVVALAQKLT